MNKPRKFHRRPDRLTVFLVAVIAVSLLAIFWISWGGPYVRYREGCRLMEAGDYEEAAGVFLCLPTDFLDSFQRYVDCREAVHGPEYWSRPFTDPKPEPEPEPPAPSRRPSRRSDSGGDDPYRASEFSSEEDFYDFYSEDFADFYDAENYYREHTD